MTMTAASAISNNTENDQRRARMVNLPFTDATAGIRPSVSPT
jgi:hypothetical protein